jgi:hypothetical protein
MPVITMAAIGQEVVAEAPCVALEVVAAEQGFEAIDIPVVPVAPAPQRGWTQWCAAGVDNEKSLTTGETTTGFCKSRGSSGRVASTGTNTGVCTTGTNTGVCTTGNTLLVLGVTAAIVSC